MIITNYATNNSFVNFKETQVQSQNDTKYREWANALDELKKPKESAKKGSKKSQIGALLKKTAGNTGAFLKDAACAAWYLLKVAAQDVGSFIKNAGEAILASGYISASFIWNRITALLMCIWTIPGIVAGVTAGTILICRNYIDKHQYPQGHEKYKVETLDKKAADLEHLYNTKPEKYYEQCSSTIFNYYDALNQIKSEKEKLETKIANLEK